MDGVGAKENCEKWMEMLVGQIDEYQDPTDIYSLALAYSEYGLALMHIPDEKEALKSFERSCEALEQITPPGEAIYCFPWKHRARVLTHAGNPDLAESILAPVLKAREKKFGTDDTVSIE